MLRLRNCALSLAMLLMLVWMLGGVSRAQDNQSYPKWELFGGYSWSDPDARLHALVTPTLSAQGAGAVNSPYNVPIRSQSRGFGTALSYNLNRWFGLTGDFSAHFGSGNHASALSDNANIYTFSAGPKFTMRGEHFTPFLEGLVGWNRLNPDGLDSDDGFGLLTGGGVDLKFAQHWAWRMIQADYMYGDHRYNNGSLLPKTRISGARLQTGLVWLLGGGAPAPLPAASCSVTPAEVMAGEPVKVTANATNFPKHRTLNYTWSTTGGKVSGTGDTVSIDTNGVAGGSYTASAQISDGKNASAQCSANFTVKEPPKNPPVISCSANPATVTSGEASTISCSCNSPDHRPVSISNWQASAGKITGSGNSATLDTGGAAAGAVNVSATCSDDRGLTAEGSTAVTVNQPPPPPEAYKKCEIQFLNKRKPARVDNDAKGCLDSVDDALLADSNAKAVVVGEQDAKEKPKTLAEQRAVNTKDYLTSGENQKAVDGSRIEPRTGEAGGQRAEIWIVPQGASFNQPGTTPVNEGRIKAQPRHPQPARKRASKAGKKAGAGQ